MAEKLITQSAFALMVGVDKSQVTRWIGKAMPVQPHGADPAIAAAWVRFNVDPTQLNRRSIGNSQVADAAAARRLSLVAIG